MKRLLVCLLLVGVVGCGRGANSFRAVRYAHKASETQVDGYDAEVVITTIIIVVVIGLVGLFLTSYRRIYFKRGKHDKAIADYTKAIRIEPDDADAYYHRGHAYDELGQSDKAIADYTEAIRINPDYAMAYYGRGYAYAELGNNVKANADFAKAKELGDKP